MQEGFHPIQRGGGFRSFRPGLAATDFAKLGHDCVIYFFRFGPDHHLVLATGLYHVADTVEVGDDVSFSLGGVLQVEPHPGDAVCDAADVFFTANVVDDVPGQGIIAGEVCGPSRISHKCRLLGGG